MEITKRNEHYQLYKEPLAVGQLAKPFHLKDLKEQVHRLGDFLDKPTLISIVPDINTSVCSIQTRAFNERLSQNKQIHFVTISNNTLAQQQHWCAAEGLDLVMLHDPENTFGKDYGVYIPDLNIYARAIFVLDTEGNICYEEIVPELTHEPDYEQAIAALDALQ
ncbi:thiol peroxidase [Enterococcus columbae]|uniref:Thioredoxin domain-containing protein n=1 Tax=Enterococcus columbae DSM 7374 = ATCC 51263 TaxID=1121865 RepID=S0KV20_9ENTE|nr:thiol peroxidase [Enterococcus columbae]EOT44830.1 hypothetical protein OMW_00015 [Enterococcus columbae DSM 7374 = ATCC 51263]EOW84123.1 hypothetical protein I568_00609 [Enterococcus columbae DSM 7374 = ATCC 51263]OJG23314.1 hypothetical protein RR47_GL000550 [Enterococcus columbae DSM 7374 = ATCC 51263]